MGRAGVQGHIDVQADIENGLVALLLVGLPVAALREARAWPSAYVRPTAILAISTDRG